MTRVKNANFMVNATDLLQPLQKYISSLDLTLEHSKKGVSDLQKEIANIQEQGRYNPVQLENLLEEINKTLKDYYRNSTTNTVYNNGMNKVALSIRDTFDKMLSQFP
jgi:phage-related protein